MLNRRNFLGLLLSIPFANYADISIADEKQLDQFLFELNDSETRKKVKTFLDEHYGKIKSKKGIYDFKVICDETNNFSSVIDSNQLVVDIYVKPILSLRKQIIFGGGVDLRMNELKNISWLEKLYNLI